MLPTTYHWAKEWIIAWQHHVPAYFPLIAAVLGLHKSLGSIRLVELIRYVRLYTRTPPIARKEPSRIGRA